MMRFIGWVTPLLGFAMFGPMAFGLIKVQTPVSKMYGGAASVVVGKVTKVTADSGVIEAATTTLKGEGVGASMKIKIQGMAEVMKGVKEGSPVVLLIGRRSASNALSVGDTWLFPQATPSSKSNFIVSKDLDLKQSFPGTTAALSRAIDEIKDGKSTMLDDVSPEMFKGAVKPLGTLPTGATAISTLRGAGGKGQTIVVTSAAGAKYYAVDATGLKPAEPVKIEPPKSPVEGAAACVFGNFGEEADKVYAMVIKGEMIERYPLDGAGQPADFLRLTGERVSNYHKDNPKWLEGATASALDANGDGRMDVLINTGAGAMLLINRGYGAFFIDADIGKVLKTSAGTPLLDGKSLWTAADVDGDGLDDLVIVAPSGEVTAVMNPKPEKK